MEVLKDLAGAEDLLLDAELPDTVVQSRGGKDYNITKINADTIPYTGTFGQSGMQSIKAKIDNSLELRNSASRNTIADLKLENGLVFNTINVLGYHTPGDGGGGTFYWDSTSIESDNSGTIIQATGITTGRWKRVYSGAVNVKWFGAKGDGDTDDTLSIQKALAVSKKIYVPYMPTEYIVNNLALTNGCTIIGDKTLIKANAGNSVFLTNQETHNITLEGFVVTDGKHLFLQTDRTNYSAYCNFKNIEVYANIEIAFKGFFIFTNWNNCISGYSGTQNVLHQFIQSIPSSEHISGTTTQGKTTNLNKLEECFIFRTGSSAVASLEIEYAYHWHITNCDFEFGNSKAIISRGCYNLIIENCWFEHNSTQDLITCTTSRGNNSHGTQLFFQNNTANLTNLTRAMFNIGASSFLSFKDNFIFQIPTNVILDYASTIGYIGINIVENNTISSGTTTFADSIKTSYDSTREFNRINILPIGKNGINSGDFTASGYTLASIASSLKPSVNILDLGISTGANYAYYSIPSKLVSLLRGKKVTFVAMGFGNGTASGTSVTIRMWKDGDTVAYNTGTGSSFVSNPADTSLKIGKVTVSIANDATTLKVGFSSGGATNLLSHVLVESISLFLGELRTIEALDFL